MKYSERYRNEIILMTDALENTILRDIPQLQKESLCIDIIFYIPNDQPFWDDIENIKYVSEIYESKEWIYTSTKMLSGLTEKLITDDLIRFLYFLGKSSFTCMFI